MNGFALRPQSYVEGASREWLLANGLGGYASSTALGANTRAYHGLLVAAMSSPADRRLLLSSLDEDMNGFLLANHQYPDVVYPEGFRYLSEFNLDPLPHFTYQIGEVRIDKKVFMIFGENTTVVRYSVIGGSGLMRIVPLVNCRNFHIASDSPTIHQTLVQGGVLLKSHCDFFLLSDKARYVRQDMNYYNFLYEEERRRGLSWKENLFSPGYFEVDLDNYTSFEIIASTWRASALDPEKSLEQELLFVNNLRAPVQNLAQAADSFIVKRGLGKSIIAGYHWFGDWGRDAMISVPGLLLVTGRFNDARAVLKIFAGAMKDGILPNDLDAGSYNTIDASLWFIQAVFSLFKYTRDLEFIRHLWPSMNCIIDSYSTCIPGACMHSDYLINTEPALTWMDAQVNGVPVTPRAGKACEINALWYSSLRIMDILAGYLGEEREDKMSERVKNSYQEFWNEDKGCLYDVINPRDSSIRPNQIIAAAISFDLLSLEQKKSIVDVVTRELLTPYGLRTLSFEDSRYIGKYEGNWNERSLAYHQGTVWPWLLGPYITAFLSVNRYSEESRVQAKEILSPLIAFNQAGINTIPEILDGDAPHMPRGCISQAWSVAEVMRAWYEDIILGGKSELFPNLHY
ncbi:MAG: glycogen debranching enzyme N-terminal domain-containing protein [Methanothrix sp.]|nr:glycogen debranching enzyme N-terminal domain-containing protein [Methanothrix sp.]